MAESIGEVESFDGLASASDAGLTERTIEGRQVASLEELLTESDETPQVEEDAQGDKAAQKPSEEPPRKEPGWIKSRVESAVQKQLGKAVEDAVSKVRAEYEQRMAPLLEGEYTRQAQKLVADGEFKSEVIALEYVKLKAGAGGVVNTPSAPSASSPQRDAQGRFMPRVTANPQGTGDPSVEQRARVLYAQADTIHKSMGIDVMETFRAEDDVRQRVLSGEWDFTDVARHMANRANGRGAPPPPLRNTNGGRANPASIAKLTDEQFAKLDKELASGKIYDLR